MENENLCVAQQNHPPSNKTLIKAGKGFNTLFLFRVPSERGEAQPFVLSLPGWRDEPPSPAEAHERGGRVGQPSHRPLSGRPVGQRDSED